MTDQWFYGYRCKTCGVMRDEGDGWPPEPCRCHKGPRWQHYTLMPGGDADGPRVIRKEADRG